MRRSELVRRMWEIIKERNLLDPTNRAFVICDTQFEDIFTCSLCRILEIEMKIWNESTEQSLQNKMSYGVGKNGLMQFLMNFLIMIAVNYCLNIIALYSVKYECLLILMLNSQNLRKIFVVQTL
ncbi:putative upstream activation factor subunit UAF30 [Trichinella spiralis]|uniref:putative upstream activation factor subunit UAF30 n=1 Tax=Trichinella spiralis TaxID=6334 RepID=UPI0001EFDD7E|nr:putative upstream activation factor subunit UAF30 [Trichinella spiralis]